MESVIKLSALDTSLIEIRLIEGRDEAYILANENYFSLVAGTKINISSALQEGVNLLNLMIKTYSLIERIRRGLFGQDWCGRFELYIDGKLRGTYNQNGGVFLGSGKYTVAKIELNIEIGTPPPTPPPGNDPKKQLLSIIYSLQKIKGMTPTNFECLKYSTPYIILKNNIKINIWKNLAKVDHVFLIDPAGNCVFAGYVGWVHRKKFYRALQQIRNDFPGV
ncbi:hypothetical protein [Planktothrix agardhii]|uniref:Uncharacterized protein n=1 Tax=Planktothrix agardhii (strain NIVA-CYA 126/8) TaxID=388467 RepID=A0A073CLT5_PLAA1|nr:hypothetical protein [Planktothrix agardhii]AQY60428.1 hypothetical protein [Planktothrix agardhii NIVA-CYA 126/8]KEI68688.1 hypothetical protein A19Y_3966 [Planktothrix agardhii NIVA-CYA 126/8]CAD5968737.1 hypothetical protein NIVACYA_04120 [Planktothrix agardhii]